MTAKRAKISKNCLLCGSMFFPWQGKPGSYCSSACSAAATLQLSEPFEIKFWKHVTKTDGCWLWSGADDGEVDGYGRIVDDAGKSIGAHRAAWILAHGSIPDGMDVLHTCDRRRCVKLQHLFLGTDSTNQKDAWEKGRQRVTTRRAHRNGKAILSAADVATIRAWLPQGVPVREFVKHYGVAEITIYHIKNRRLWAHVA